MAWVHKTMIVADAVVEQCRAMAEQLAGAGGSNMWTRAVAQADAPTVTTHWISAGLIEDTFAAIIGSPEALAAATGLPIEQAAALLSMCIVTDAEPEQAVAENGLVFALE